MKKNIAIIILSVLLVFLLFYSFAQRTIAARATQEAVTQRIIAEEQRAMAEQQAITARIAADSANVAKARAEAIAEQAREALERCK